MNNGTAINIEGNKAEFLNLLKKYIGNDAGYQQLVNYLTNKSDFFTAPAAMHGPMAYEGGLTRHALNVFDRFLINITTEDNLRKKEERMQEDQSMKLAKSGAICCLLGDISLANFFELNTEGNPAITKYRIKDNALSYGHPDDPGIESVYMLNNFIKLSRTESFAIRFHTGDFSNPYTQKAFRNNYLAYEVYRANLDALYLDEKGADV